MNRAQRSLRIAGWLVALLVLSGNPSAQQPAPNVLTNAQVVEMVRGKQPAKEIVGRIKGLPCRFDLSASGLRRLKLAGVSEPVLLAMIEAPLAELSQPTPPDTDDVPAGDERAERAAHCPKCVVVAISQWDQASKSFRPGAVSENQAKWLHRDLGDSLEGKVAPGLWYTNDRSVADYDLAWGVQQGEGVQSGSFTGWTAVYDAQTGFRLLATSCEGRMRGEDPAGRCLADAALQLRKLLKATQL